MEKRVEWKDVLVTISACIAALAIIARWMAGWIKAAILAELNDPEGGALTMIRDDVRGARGDIQRLEIETVRVSTWLDLNKARLAAHGGAVHESPFEIDTAWLREKIVANGYVPDPVMLEEFKRLVADPLLPPDDSTLWSIIEQRFGMEALAQEVMRLGADGDTAPAIWILCIRKAKKIGCDQLLREIGIMKDEGGT